MTLALTATALLLLKALISLAEHAIRLADPETLSAMARRGSRGAARAHWFAIHPEKLWATTRTLTRLCLIAATVLLAAGFTHPEWALVVLLPVLFLTAELLPRGIVGGSTGRTERLAPRVSTLLMGLFHVFRPLIWLSERYGRALGRAGTDERQTATREDLQLLVDQESGRSDMAIGEREMIARIFEFSHLTAADSMVPLKEMCTISVDATVKDAVALIAREGFSRLPVHRDRMEDVVGILHHMDLLRAREATQLVATIMRPPLFVPGTQEIDDILVILQRRAASAAVVVDEFGKTVGLLTLEDILEEIVGEIDDEFDLKDRFWRPCPDGGGYLIAARTRLELVEQTFDLTFELDDDEEIETLAGYVLSRLKRIPLVGERVELPDGVSLSVKRASERAIEELLLAGPVRARERER